MCSLSEGLVNNDFFQMKIVMAREIFGREYLPYRQEKQ